MPPRAFLAVFLALAGPLAACGPSAEERRMEEVRRICEGLVPGTTTLREADAALGADHLAPAWGCGSFAGPVGNPDVCEYGAAICQFDFAYHQGDASACAQTPSGSACWYGCGIRVSDASWADLRWDAVLCARFFYPPQPTPLIP